jgi:hypothetical protein
MCRQSFDMKTRNSQKGISIVELMIAVVVITVGILPVLGLISRSNNNITKAQQEISLAIYGNGLVQHITSGDFLWDENTPSVGAYTTNKSAVGVDSGENANSVLTFDDLDDFHGYSKNFTTDISGVVNVRYVSFVNGVMTNSVNPTDFKLVEVTVTRLRDGVPLTEKVLTVKANGV